MSYSLDECINSVIRTSDKYKELSEEIKKQIYEFHISRYDNDKCGTYDFIECHHVENDDDLLGAIVNRLKSLNSLSARKYTIRFAVKLGGSKRLELETKYELKEKSCE